jgi:hypothetical protein
MKNHFFLDCKKMNEFFKSLFRLSRLYSNGEITFSSNPEIIINSACDEIEKLRELTRDEVRDVLEGKTEMDRVRYFVEHHGKKRR